MNREELATTSERIAREQFAEKLPRQTAVRLFGSRACGGGRWNSDFDLWIDGERDVRTLSAVTDAIEESIVPFRVDMVTMSQLNGNFGEQVRRNAVQCL